MNCTICHLKITLIPSAKERAEKYGMPAEYFTGLFREHATCTVNKRSESAVNLTARKITH